MDFAMEFDILLKEEVVGIVEIPCNLRATIKMEKNVQSCNFPVSSLLLIVPMNYWSAVNYYLLNKNLYILIICIYPRSFSRSF